MVLTRFSRLQNESVVRCFCLRQRSPPETRTPFHLVGSFELFGYVLSLFHLLNQLRKQFFRMPVNLFDLLFQLARQHKPRIGDPLMVTQIIVIHHPESADFRRLRCFQAGIIVIAHKFIFQPVFSSIIYFSNSFMI